MARAEVDKFLRRCPRCGDIAASGMSVRGWDHSLFWVCEACRSCGPVVEGGCILVEDIAEPSPPKPEAATPPEQREEVLTYSL
jgi:hypothetical protein